jgi:hypothetical protein
MISRYYRYQTIVSAVFLIPPKNWEIVIPSFLEETKTVVKGTVQRKLTGVLSGINRKLMIHNVPMDILFFNLKGLRSLKSKIVFSALTCTLF